MLRSAKAPHWRAVPIPVNSDLYELSAHSFDETKIAKAARSPRAELTRAYLMSPKIPKAPRMPKTLLREVRELQGEPLPDYRAMAQKARAQKTRTEVPVAQEDRGGWPAFAVATAASLMFAAACVIRGI